MPKEASINAAKSELQKLEKQKAQYEQEIAEKQSRIEIWKLQISALKSLAESAPDLPNK